MRFGTWGDEEDPTKEEKRDEVEGSQDTCVSRQPCGERILRTWNW